ncbi:putative signal peptide protein [Puccinia sorghi]|uniref:Putative signal peptide protein n=1 Tax=Puccinia sorghi TaxID=27349 RepID=A0A0L6VC77_9BASI|nr:putative signal peptide protein [Puccinia sorghi]
MLLLLNLLYYCHSTFKGKILIDESSTTYPTSH